MNQSELFSPLSREEVIAAVEGGNPRRIPLVRAKWWGEGLVEQYGAELGRFDRFPEDVVQLWIGNPVDPSKMNLSWEWRQDGAHDSRAVIDDWSKLDEFLDKLPDPATDVDWEPLEREAEAAHRERRYLLWGFWNLFFERPWMIRGMENLMVDYYVETDNIHRLHAAMADQYSRYIAEAARRLSPDGFWTSDDLGHQSGPMMSPQIFHDIIHPYYCRVGEAARKAGMHFWLHSCGDNTLLLPDLVDAGVDVFHPVQKHTMDEAAVMEEFGGKITFLAGIDVQHALQEADADGVRREVRFLIDTFDRPDGRMCIAAGNGIVSGTPIENIEAFLDEAITYGAEHRMRYTEAKSAKVKLTYEEYRHFPDDGNTHELIDGEHFMAPAPGTNHQSVSRHIQFQLYRQLEETGIAQVYDAPTDVELSAVDVVQPDIAVVAHAREHIISPSRIIGAPDLVVEILSPSTRRKDAELKRRLYEQRGVPVYWLVDADAQTVTVFARPTEAQFPGEDAASAEYRQVGTFHEEVEIEIAGVTARVDLAKVW